MILKNFKETIKYCKQEKFRIAIAAYNHIRGAAVDLCKYDNRSPK